MHILSTNDSKKISSTKFDENRRIYFLIKEEKVFIKCMEILEKFSIITKTEFNSDLIYSKKYLKAEKERTQKLDFNVYMHQ